MGGTALAHGGEGRLDRVVVAQINPVPGWEVIQGKQGIAVAGELLGCLRRLRRIDLQECVESADGLCPAWEPSRPQEGQPLLPIDFAT